MRLIFVLIILFCTFAMAMQLNFTITITYEPRFNLPWSLHNKELDIIFRGKSMASTKLQYYEYMSKFISNEGSTALFIRPLK